GQTRVTECAGGAWTPEPDGKIVVGELKASLVMVTLPLALPGVAGAKVTANVTLWPGLRMIPAGAPLTSKPGEVTLKCEMVTLELPEAVSVTMRVVLSPTVTLPKFRFETSAVSLPRPLTPAQPANTTVTRIGNARRPLRLKFHLPLLGSEHLMCGLPS